MLQLHSHGAAVTPHSAPMQVGSPHDSAASIHSAVSLPDERVIAPVPRSALSRDLLGHTEVAQKTLLHESISPRKAASDVRLTFSQIQLERSIEQAQLGQMRADLRNAQTRLIALEKAVTRIDSAGGKTFRPMPSIAENPQSLAAARRPPRPLSAKIIELDAIGAHQDRHPISD